MNPHQRKTKLHGRSHAYTPVSEHYPTLLFGIQYTAENQCTQSFVRDKYRYIWRKWLKIGTEFRWPDISDICFISWSMVNHSFISIHFTDNWCAVGCNTFPSSVSGIADHRPWYLKMFRLFWMHFSYWKVNKGQETCYCLIIWMAVAPHFGSRWTFLNDWTHLYIHIIFGKAEREMCRLWIHLKHLHYTIRIELKLKRIRKIKQ